MAYAKGTYALGICDRCGGTYKLAQLRHEVQNEIRSAMLVCPRCFDIDHPQWKIKTNVVDRIGLRKPRPDRPDRGLFGWNPVSMSALSMFIGKVYASGMTQAPAPAPTPAPPPPTPAPGPVVTPPPIGSVGVVVFTSSVTATGIIGDLEYVNDSSAEVDAFNLGMGALLGNVQFGPRLLTSVMGASSTMLLGSVTIRTTGSTAITGVQGTATTGTVTIRPRITQQLTGVTGTVSVGTVTAAAAPVTIFTDNLFAPTSFWYTEIPAGAPTHPNNTAMVNNWVAQDSNYYSGVDINISAFSAPVYIAAADTPTQRVYQHSNGDAGWSPYAPLDDAWAAVPIPAGAQPSAGTDQEMVIYQPSTNTFWEFWRMQWTGTQWQARWGGRMQNVSTDDGIWENPLGTTACGLPFLGGQVTAAELQRGEIKHAIGFALPELATGFSWPANRSDGSGNGIIKEGNRFYLDKSINVDALNIHPLAKIIGKALQKYGGVVWDFAGAMTMRFQNSISYSSNPYPALLNGANSYDVFNGFPWGSLRFLPDDYGKPGTGTGSSTHFSDNFDDNSRNTTLWVVGNGEGVNTAGVTVVETNQRLQVSPPISQGTAAYSGYTSASRINLTGKAVQCQLVQRTNVDGAETQFYVAMGGTEMIGFEMGDSNINAFKRVGGVNTNLGSIVYQSSMWLRIIESNGTITMQAASNNNGAPGAWSNVGSSTVASAFSISDVTVSMVAGTWASVPAPGAAIFENFSFGNITTTPSDVPATTSGGTTYYVDNVLGNNNNNGLSPTTPWLTLPKAAGFKNYQPGDTILFKRGGKYTTTGYNAIFDCSGTAAQPVLIDAYGTGANPVFENTNSVADVILLVRGSYCIVQNITFMKTNPNTATANVESAISFEGTGHRYTSCEAFGLGNGARMTGTGHRVDHCYFHDMIMVVNDTTNPDNDYGAQGLVIYNSSNIRIDNNVFRRMRQPSPDYGQDGCGVEIFNANSNVEVYNNIFEDCMTVFEIGGTNSANVVSNIKFHHNLIYNGVSFGIFQNNTSGTWGVNISNLQIDNNTIVKTGTTNANLIWFATAASSTVCSFRNNIVKYANVTNMFFNPGSFVHTNNLYQLTNVTNNANSSFAFHSTEVLGNPQFVDEAGANYRLQSTSPARTMGINLGFTSDIEGTPITSPYAAGCYES